jgi:flagellar basal-body rod modification protein FlgD
MISGAISSVTGASTATSATTPFSSLDPADFVTLLLTEITNQNPTDPIDTAGMINSFSCLSQLAMAAKTNDYLEDIAQYSSSAGDASAVGYLGRTVSYGSNEITVSGAGAETAGFTLGSDASDVTVTISDANGTVVRTLALGKLSAGTNSFAWDGTNNSGMAAGDGTYTFTVSATDAAGNAVSASSGGTATVIGVTFRNGAAYLVTDQATIPLRSITGVKASST